jgi:hypothetical protein
LLRRCGGGLLRRHWVHKNLHTRPRTSNDVPIPEVDPNCVRKKFGWDGRPAFSHRLLRRCLPTSSQSGIRIVCVESDDVGVAGGALRVRHRRNII